MAYPGMSPAYVMVKTDHSRAVKFPEAASPGKDGPNGPATGLKHINRTLSDQSRAPCRPHGELSGRRVASVRPPVRVRGVPFDCGLSCRFVRDVEIPGDGRPKRNYRVVGIFREFLSSRRLLPANYSATAVSRMRS
jgi:hypothetical protein